MRTSIATVCVSGTLVDKLHACAAAGFDGVEVFEPDLIAAPESPDEIRAVAERLGLTLDLFQPLRDVEGVDAEEFARVLRRADAKFALAARMGIGTVLCCSNVATATIDDDDTSAAQLRALGDAAARHGVRIAFEALAWGRYIDDYRRAWRVVELAAHPAVGVCLDSFHILSRGHDPAAIRDIPGERIFFLQLADAPRLELDVLSWSRHHRLFPGEGSFDLVDFMGHVLHAGYTGPWSLEVFNDTFRQTDAARTAQHAHRALQWLEDAVARAFPDLPGLSMLPDSAAPSGVDFVEIKAEDTSAIEVQLAQLGFTSRGRHRTKPVTLWTSGRARIVLNEQHARGAVPHLAAIGFEVDDAAAVSRRLAQLGAPRAWRRTYASEERLDAAVAPGGTEVFWTQASDAGDPAWTAEFEHGEQLRPPVVRGVDHVSMTQPWQEIDETVLFYTAAFGLRAESATEVPSPDGLVQSRVLAGPPSAMGDRVRLPLNVAPPALAGHGDNGALPQHIAFTCDNVRALVRGARERGLDTLRMPPNYYDDLEARFDLDPAFLAELRDLSIAYDRDGDGEYLQAYTATVGQVFWEFVERRGAYDGFGAGNAGIRLTAQRGSRQAGAGR
ncbi:MAG: sugar phosphate isomerase/epimerase and 4-hydroxyphenylpyruvate domain-containing protein [Microbacterium sp.]|uniref:bifunctional sugar phosphate isomerase/epimerase/4-hydroxyphenylpyruvate dioxygenase family protein n=1 Tax=Microbacterium sp. TaxID=51671 RepID=UPI001AC8C5E4|nr:sugar phosphate isomerase/epimerase and 4-hydroxyphenylpyruvate domain-containing protein [Microbacterium sp.]MBN9177247.1 sugar phosphate isomerase/epimerase and 4-hydroxyphenylpyruvate domain-containing protein [Microbacterium sp.]